MRIAWVQDNSRPHGGAELSNRCVVEVGEGLGFNVVGVTPDWFPEKVLLECDAIVVNNFFEFSSAQVGKIFAALERKPYVKYEHDHRELRRVGYARPVFEGARLCVFLSPFHLANHRRAFPGMAEPAALPLAIRERDFYPEAVERKSSSAVLVGGWVRGGKVKRSVIEFMRERPDLKFSTVGIPVPGATYIPHVPLAGMRRIFSEHEYLVHLPDMLCAGERVVFEAALCGCKVVMNENVGHASWGFNLEDVDRLRRTLREATEEFWMLVRERCG